MAEVSRTPFKHPSATGDALRGDLWTTNSTSQAAVVVCHGFKGFKDWGFFPFASRALARRLDCPVVSFNFSGCGVGEDLETFSDPQGFGHNTFSRECTDLDSVLDGLAGGALGDLTFARVRSLGVLGHSRGGVAAILAAERSDVAAVATWAAIRSPRRYAEIFAGLDPSEHAEVVNARTGDVLPLYRDVLEDLEADPGRFDLAASLRRSGVPLLVVHGTADAAVPPDDARVLAGAAPGARLELIDGAGHTFEAGHPFGGASPELSRAISLTVEHFRLNLTGGRRLS